MSAPNINVSNQAPILADHPALDLINTVARVDGVEHDYFRRDIDVWQWLVRMGIAPDADVPAFDEGALLKSARGLREVVRELVVVRKAGKLGDPAALNECLAKAPSRLMLHWSSPLILRLERVVVRQSPEGLLAPLAEAAAELLAQGDFTLVRNCEHPECVLWFYDRTKSHRRRWCSMSVCGNRNKVAEFRRRQGQPPPSMQEPAN